MSKDKNRILVIQPCIPSYRVDFYNSISKYKGVELCVKASLLDSDNLESDVKEAYIFKSYLDLYEKNVCKKMFSFQKNIPFIFLKKHDAVVFTGNPRYITNYIYLVFCKFNKIKVIWWGQGWSAGTTKKSYLLKMLISRFYDGVIYYTDTELERAKKSIFFHPKSIALNNGLNGGYIENVIQETGMQVGGRDPDKLRLVFIGRLTEKSGIIFLINTLSLCSDIASLKIIGGGALMPEAKLLADKYSKLDIEFCGAVYDEEDIAVLLDGMDFFIYGGAVGLSLIHSFYYSIPAIVHNSIPEHMPEICVFQESVNGVSFKKNDASSLVASIKKCLGLKRSGKLTQMQTNALKSVKGKYDTKIMAERFVKFIETICE